MNKAKRNKLERRGWKVGSAAEFLGLTADEARFIELKPALSNVGWGLPHQTSQSVSPESTNTCKKGRDRSNLNLWHDPSKS